MASLCILKLSCFLFLTRALPSNLNCRSDSLSRKLMTLCSASHSCAARTQRSHSQQSQSVPGPSVSIDSSSKNGNTTAVTWRHTHTTGKEKNGLVREDHHAKQWDSLSRQNKLRKLWETKSSTEMQKIPPKETALVTLLPILKFMQPES